MGYKKVSGKIKFWKLTETEVGEVLVNDGIYIGEEAGKFGPQYRFREPDQFVVLSGRQLGWLLDNYASPGDKCRVIYGGQEILTKGNFKGKPVHQFELELAEDDCAVSPVTIIEQTVKEASPQVEVTLEPAKKVVKAATETKVTPVSKLVAVDEVPPEPKKKTRIVKSGKEAPKAINWDAEDIEL